MFSSPRVNPGVVLSVMLKQCAVRQYFEIISVILAVLQNRSLFNNTNMMSTSDLITNLDLLLYKGVF